MTVASAPRVVVGGPASWNHLIVLDRLPEPVAHMQFARAELHTVGGTSAGKAVHLVGLGVAATLHAFVGPDEAGSRVRAALARAGVAARMHASERTERHTNLMTQAGERVSLYTATPSDADPDAIEQIAEDMDDAGLAVIDLCAAGALLIARGVRTPIWTDLHDYDGDAQFHESFVRAADVVFMNDDATNDAWALLRSCIDRGPRLAICTLGARGAIAMDAAGHRYEVAAFPASVVDTNGAGDAFFAGFLAAHLAGAGVEECLHAGAGQAVVALGSMHLHPALGDI